MSLVFATMFFFLVFDVLILVDDVMAGPIYGLKFFDPWLIVYPFSGVRRCRSSQFSNIFSSETAWPIKAKFYVEPPWEGGESKFI